MPKGNLNFTFNLKTLGGTPTLKKKTIAKLAQTKLENLYHIWQAQNRKKGFTFREHHSS